MKLKLKAIFYCNNCAEYYVDSINNRVCTKCKCINVKVIKLYEENSINDPDDNHKFEGKSK